MLRFAYVGFDKYIIKYFFFKCNNSGWWHCSFDVVFACPEFDFTKARDICIPTLRWAEITLKATDTLI